MKSRTWLVVCVLAASASCGDDSSAPTADAAAEPSTGTDAGAGSTPASNVVRDAGMDAASPPALDAAPRPVAPAPSTGDAAGAAVGDAAANEPLKVDAGDAGGDASSGLDAASDAGADPCPPALALGGATIRDEQVERPLDELSGGTPASGTYVLTKRELVINPEASELEKAGCREHQDEPSREALELVAESDHTGSFLVRSQSDTGPGETRDYVNRGRYRVDGNLIEFTGSIACDTRTTALEDGGMESKRAVETPDVEDDPTWFIAGDGSIKLIQEWAGDGDLPSCWYVSTFTSSP